MKHSEDPLVQQIVDAIGKPPKSRSDLVRTVASMRSLEQNLTKAVRYYEEQVPRYVAHMKAGKPHHGVIPLYFEKAQSGVMAAELAVTGSIDVVAAAIFGVKPQRVSVNRHFTSDARLAMAMPAAFSSTSVVDAKHGIERMFTHYDATIAWYPSWHYPDAPAELKAMGDRATRPVLMYDLIRNGYVVADPWLWRREVAERFDEQMYDDQIVRYFPERATPAMKRKAKKF